MPIPAGFDWSKPDYDAVFKQRITALARIRAERERAALASAEREQKARAEAQAAAEPKNANAWYQMAYALGRYSQGISVAKALEFRLREAQVGAPSSGVAS